MIPGIQGTAAQAKYRGEAFPPVLSLQLGEWWMQGRGVLLMHPNHSVVLLRWYSDTDIRQIWSDGGERSNATYVAFQADGNFVAYETTGPDSQTALSATDTGNHPNCTIYLVDQGDMHGGYETYFWIRGPHGEVVWDSRSNGMRHIPPRHHHEEHGHHNEKHANKTK